MSGHSKWSTIKRKKEKTDNQRAKIFTKIGREIAVAVREGGPDPASNSKLKDIISKAKANNVPNDNIDRIIKKAAGDGNADNYEEIMYEGYGPSGIAVIVETLTDNRNRTAGDMRHYFDKFGGNMGQSGCVSFMFSKQGVIVIENDGDIDEEKPYEILANWGFAATLQVWLPCRGAGSAKPRLRGYCTDLPLYIDCFVSQCLCRGRRLDDPLTR